MRYYDLQIIDPKQEANHTKDIWIQPLLHYATHTSFAGLSGNLYNPGYLKIEFDVLHASLGMNSKPSLTIHGIDLETVKNAQQLKQKHLFLKAGMSMGMPLSQPNAGPIFSGVIKEVLGNWTGKEMSLQFFCEPINSDFINTVYFQCHAHQSLREAIILALQGQGVSINANNIPDSTKCPEKAFFAANSISEFADEIQRKTLGWGMYSEYIVGFQNPNNHTWTFYQKNLPPKSDAKSISFEEMIGQPTYNGLASPAYNKGKKAEEQIWDLSVTTVMRGDIQLGDLIELPTALQNNNLLGTMAYHDERPANLRASQSMFCGQWQVAMIHHVGKSRNSKGENWSSTFGLQHLPRGDEIFINDLPPLKTN